MRSSLSRHFDLATQASVGDALSSFTRTRKRDIIQRRFDFARVFRSIKPNLRRSQPIRQIRSATYFTYRFFNPVFLTNSPYRRVFSRISTLVVDRRRRHGSEFSGRHIHITNEFSTEATHFPGRHGFTQVSRTSRNDPAPGNFGERLLLANMRCANVDFPSRSSGFQGNNPCLTYGEPCRALERMGCFHSRVFLFAFEMQLKCLSPAFEKPDYRSDHRMPDDAPNPGVYFLQGRFDGVIIISAAPCSSAASTF